MKHKHPKALRREARALYDRDADAVARVMNTVLAQPLWRRVKWAFNVIVLPLRHPGRWK